MSGNLLAEAKNLPKKKRTFQCTDEKTGGPKGACNPEL